MTGKLLQVLLSCIPIAFMTSSAYKLEWTVLKLSQTGSSKLTAYLILSNCEANSYFALTWLVQIHFRELTSQCVLSPAKRYYDMLCQREISSYSVHCDNEHHFCFNFDLYLTMIMCALSWTAPCDGHCRCWRCAHALAAVNISTPFSQLGCNKRNDHSTLHSPTSPGSVQGLGINLHTL